MSNFVEENSESLEIALTRYDDQHRSQAPTANMSIGLRSCRMTIYHANPDCFSFFQTFFRPPCGRMLISSPLPGSP